MTCEHRHVRPEVCDQTIGVICIDCHELVAWCWAEHHIPETLWNRVCEADPHAFKCKQNRADYCAVCCQKID